MGSSDYSGTKHWRLPTRDFFFLFSKCLPLVALQNAICQSCGLPGELQKCPMPFDMQRTYFISEIKHFCRNERKMMLFPKHPTSQPHEHQGHQTTIRCEWSDLAGRNRTAATEHPKEGSESGQCCPTSLQWVGWLLLHLCYFSSSSDCKKTYGFLQSGEASSHRLQMGTQVRPQSTGSLEYVD